jgi:hypothetical protein
VETTNSLRRRVDVLEQAADVIAPLACLACGRLHVEEAMSLEQLGARYEGSEEALPEVCACPCCQSTLDDLAARFARHLKRSL